MRNRTIHRRAGWPRATLVICAAGLAAAVGLDLVSCGAETSGQEITFATAISGGAGEGTAQEFTTYAGWRVKLDQAYVAVGPIYYYEGEPQASLLQRILGPGVARACPTHAQYNKGTVLGEILEQHVVDLLAATPTDTGQVFGLAGTCRAVELHLHPLGEISAGSPAAAFDALGGDTVHLSGSAEKEGQTVRFSGGMTIPDEGLMQIVESISADVSLEPDAAGTLVVEVLLDQWLASVDFSSLTEKQGDDYRFTENTQAYNALLRGIRSRGAYRVSWR